MNEQKSRSIRSIFWGIVFLSGLIFFSCANEDCISIFNNHLLVEFIRADTLESGEIILEPVDTVFHEVTAIGNDSVFYTPDTLIRSILTLPVDPAGERTSFRLEMLDSITYDTLSLDPIEIDTNYHVNPTPHIITVTYRRRQRIISEDCGVEITYTNVKVDESTFQTINLVEDKLSRLNEANIEVFF
ncbi:MAG: hypothetical protein MI975_29145 [Cytophagales bacterium]|nr:hypothetical protein [Cytophagales bacterium]